MSNYFNTVPNNSPERYFLTPSLLLGIEKEVRENHDYKRFNEILRILLREHEAHNFENDCPDACWKIYELLYFGYQDKESVSRNTAKKITQSFALKKVFAKTKIPEDVEFICEENDKVLINKAVLILSNDLFPVMFSQPMRESKLSQIDYSKSLSKNSAIAIKNFFYMVHMIHIGNSLGVRIPKAIIQQVGFKEDMDLVFKVTGEGLLITPEKQAREGWEQKFKSPKKGIKKDSLIGEFSNKFDEDEWQW